MKSARTIQQNMISLQEVSKQETYSQYYQIKRSKDEQYVADLYKLTEELSCISTIPRNIEGFTVLNRNGYLCIDSNYKIDIERDNKISYLNAIFQERREKRLEEVWCMKKFIREIVREQADRREDEYVLWSHELSIDERKIILSYLVDAEDYEFYCENHTRLQAIINEYDENIQTLIDEECNYVLFEDMNEFGRIFSRDSDHGDYLWS